MLLGMPAAPPRDGCGDNMALNPPGSLSPSKVSAFTSCPLAFRFASIDHLPEPPTVHTVLGTIVHRSLEGLFWHHPRGQRSVTAAETELQQVFRAMGNDPELAQLNLDADGRSKLRADAGQLVKNYFEIEDPDAIHDVAVEITMEADIGGTRFRGILDRLDLSPDGLLSVVDYKTGRVPPPRAEAARLSGVQFYALLCRQVLGRLPERVRLLYLRGPVVIEADPTEQSMAGLSRKTSALWSAIVRACQYEDFRPRPSALCNWCHFRPICPAHGGDPCALHLLDPAPLPTDPPV